MSNPGEIIRIKFIIPEIVTRHQINEQMFFVILDPIDPDFSEMIPHDLASGSIGLPPD
jgi:hypothetical protein